MVMCKWLGGFKSIQDESNFSFFFLFFFKESVLRAQDGVFLLFCDLRLKYSLDHS